MKDNKPKVTTFKSRAKRIAKQKKETPKIEPRTQQQTDWFEEQYEKQKNVDDREAGPFGWGLGYYGGY